MVYNMKNKCILAFILSLIISITCYSQSNVMESLSFHSNILNRDISYSIYLPSGYNNSQRLYPALYLLHGYTDDQTAWLQSGNMQDITDKAISNGNAAPMIVIMPDAWDTWYVNQYDGKMPYEDMFFKELIPFMEKTYRIRPDVRNRAISGLSMGGYGSFLYSLHHPDMFCACCPLSAAVFTDEAMNNNSGSNAKSFIDLFHRLYGKNLEGWEKNSVLDILKNLDKDKTPKVRYYIDCGDDDFLLEGNFEVHKLMKAKGIQHEFRVRDGAHQWRYWRSALPTVLEFVSQPFLKN